MAALIIPFKRPEPKAEPEQGIPPPIVEIADGWWIYFGRREQLIAYGVLAEDQFPIAPKRRAYHRGDDGTISVHALRKGLFKVRLDAHYHVDDPDGAEIRRREIRRLTRIADRVWDRGHTERINTAQKKTSALFGALEMWRRSMCAVPHEDELFDQMQEALDAFQTAAAELALYRAKPEAVLQAPTDAEPEHAQ